MAGIQNIDALSLVADEMRKLHEENERLKADRTERWQLQNRLNKLARKANDQEKRIAELLEKAERLYRDNQHWRKAVRYEQSLKKPRKRVRHLPTLSMVKRAGRDLFKNLPAAFGVTGSNRERVFLSHWRRENKQQRGYNGGRGVLESILSENPNEHPADITQRDATVAATVIQWLGTNCGQSFLYEVARDVEKSRKKAAG